MKQWLKRNIGVLYICVLTLILGVYLVRSGELPRMLDSLWRLDVRWVWAGALCILVYLLLRATTLKYYLWSRKCDIRFHQALIISGIGQFYSAITPSASGGQPLQVLAMHKRGIPISTGTAAVSIKFIAFQLSFMLMGGALWATHMHMVADQLGPVRWLVALGYLINATLIVVVLLTMSSKGVVDRLVRWAIRMALRLRLLRDADKAHKKAEDTLEDYRQSLMTLKSRPMDAAWVFLLSLLQVVFYMGVVCCLYHAFQLSGTDNLSLLTLQLLLFITAAFVPLPGAAGAQETGFYLFFRGIIPDASIVTLMVCWRFFTYYMLLILGLLAVIVDGLMLRRKRGGEAADD